MTVKNQTEKLFYEKEYERSASFTAQILSVDFMSDEEKGLLGETEEAIAEIVFDRTLFFPEEGGQESDRGYLYTGIREDFVDELRLEVVHVSMKDGVIKHRCKAVQAEPLNDETATQEAGRTAFLQSLTPGMMMTGVIDERHRLDQMQQHTAEHIISGLVHAAYGYANVGFHLSKNSVTMDYDGILTAEQVADIEIKANEVVWRNIPVCAYFPTDEELKRTSYRSKKEIEGAALRLVEVPGVDLCACCAPHVERTGEIGLIKVTRLQNYKGGVRLSIVCGARALRLFGESFDMLGRLAVSLSTSVEKIPDRFASMQEEINSLKEILVSYKKEKEGSLTDSAVTQGEHAVLVVGAEYGNDVRNIVNKLMELHTGYCAVFAGNSAKGYRYCLGSKSQDAKAAQAGLQVLFAARGGGSAQMVQGSIPAGTDRDQLENLPLWLR